MQQTNKIHNLNQDIPVGSRLFVTVAPWTWSRTFLLRQPEDRHLGHRLLPKSSNQADNSTSIFLIVLPREELYVIFEAASKHAKLSPPLKRHQSGRDY